MSALILLLLALAQSSPSTAGKKLIKYGQEFPNTAYVRDHIAKMEKLPFDGIVICVTQTAEPRMREGAIGFRAFGRERFKKEDWQHAIDELRATKFKKFTDNFIP